MITGAVSIAASARAGSVLPNLGEYLRAIFDLGRRSLRPALPALLFLYFYRLGIGAYIALTGSGYPAGGIDPIGAILPQIAIVGSFLPVVLLIYTPFLPLQDALIRGSAITFVGAIRQVLETAWNFILSGIIQVVILLTPFVALALAVGILMPEGAGPEGSGARLAAVGLVVFAGLFWFVVGGFFLMFATPAVVLDREGPVQSVGLSVVLVQRNFGRVLGRLIVFLFLATILYFVAITPSAILSTVERASGAMSAPFKVAGLIWSSAIDALFFPFWVAALMILYRALVPPAGGPRAASPVAGDEEMRPPASRVPFE